MKKNLFKMALVAIVLAFASMSFTSCEMNDPFSGSGKMNYGLKWDNIVKYVYSNFFTVVELEGDHYEFYRSESGDTLYIVKPTQCTGDTTYIVVPVEVHDTISVTVNVHDTITETITVHDTITETITVQDTVYEVVTHVMYDTVYVTNDHGYVVEVKTGSENGYEIIPGDSYDTIVITFAVNDDYSLDIQPVYNRNIFTSSDPTSYMNGGRTVLSGANARNGMMSYDRSSSNAIRRMKAETGVGGRDTVWLTSVDNRVSGTATQAYVSRAQNAGTRSGFNVAKDSCIYTFNNAGINYNMNIVAESLEGQYDGKTKTMLAALPDGATWEIVNTVDRSNYVVHEGNKCYKVHQVVNGTFKSRVMPERGSTRIHTDVVTLDNETNMDMPVIYLVGEPVTVNPEPQDTTVVTPQPEEPQGFIFPDGEKAIAAQISVVADRSKNTLEEAILIHTSKSIYWVVAGQYVGSAPCTDLSLYNSLYMLSGVWTPAYLVTKTNGVVWYSQKDGSGYPGISKNQIDEYIKNGKAHITTNYTGSFVRDMTLKHVGQTTTFSIDGNSKFTASSSTVTH